MKRGDSFSDIAEVLLTVDYTLGTGVIYTPPIDTSGFNSVSLVWIIGPSVASTYAEVYLALKHADNSTGPWVNISPNDVIGPIGDFSGTWKALRANMVEKGLFNNIYKVCYIGQKNYLQGLARHYDVLSPTFFSSFLLKTLVQTGKCADKYPLIS